MCGNIGFGIGGYSLVPSGADDRVYILECVRESILSSVPEEERAMSVLWINDILSITEKNLAEGAMGSEAFILRADDGSRSGMLWMGTSKDQFTCDSTGYILGIYVKKDLRGKGLGRALIASAEQWCRINGHVTLTLNVGTENGIAKNLYESSGFRPQTVVMRKMLF